MAANISTRLAELKHARKMAYIAVNPAATPMRQYVFFTINRMNIENTGKVDDRRKCQDPEGVLSMTFGLGVSAGDGLKYNDIGGLACISLRYTEHSVASPQKLYWTITLVLIEVSA